MRTAVQHTLTYLRNRAKHASSCCVQPMSATTFFDLKLADSQQSTSHTIPVRRVVRGSIFIDRPQPNPRVNPTHGQLCLFADETVHFEQGM